MIVPSSDSTNPGPTAGPTPGPKPNVPKGEGGRLHASMGVGEAAGLCLEERFNAVARALGDLHESPAGVREVHALRVATRRATSVLELFGPHLDAAVARKARRMLRRLRRAAGAVRACDVQEELLLAFERDGEGEASVAAELMIGRVRRERAEARRTLARRRERCGPGKVRRTAERLARTVHLALGRIDAEGVTAYSHSVSPLTMDGAVRAAIAASARAFIEAITGVPAGDFEALHAARLRGKRLRYLIELSQGCIDDDLGEACVNVLRKFQDRLGDVNDRHELAARVRAAAEDLGLRPGGRTAAAFEALSSALLAERDRLFAEFEAWWERRRDRLGVALERVCDPRAAAGADAGGGTEPKRADRGDRGVPSGGLADELDHAIAGAIRLIARDRGAQEAQAS